MEELNTRIEALFMAEYLRANEEFASILKEINQKVDEIEQRNLRVGMDDATIQQSIKNYVEERLNQTFILNGYTAGTYRRRLDNFFRDIVRHLIIRGIKKGRDNPTIRRHLQDFLNMKYDLIKNIILHDSQSLYIYDFYMNTFFDDDDHSAQKIYDIIDEYRTSLNSSESKEAEEDRESKEPEEDGESKEPDEDGESKEPEEDGESKEPEGGEEDGESKEPEEVFELDSEYVQKLKKELKIFWDVIKSIQEVVYNSSLNTELTDEEKEAHYDRIARQFLKKTVTTERGSSSVLEVLEEKMFDVIKYIILHSIEHGLSRETIYKSAIFFLEDERLEYFVYPPSPSKSLVTLFRQLRQGSSETFDKIIERLQQQHAQKQNNNNLPQSSESNEQKVAINDDAPLGSYDGPISDEAVGSYDGPSAPSKTKQHNDVVKSAEKYIRYVLSMQKYHDQATAEFFANTINDANKVSDIVSIIKSEIQKETFGLGKDSVPNFYSIRTLSKRQQIFRGYKQNIVLYENKEFGIQTVVNANFTDLRLTNMFALTFRYILTFDIDDKLVGDDPKEWTKNQINRLHHLSKLIFEKTGVRLLWRIYDTDHGTHIYCSSHYFIPNSEIACWFMYYMQTDINHFAFSLMRNSWGVRISPKKDKFDEFVAKLRYTQSDEQGALRSPDVIGQEYDSTGKAQYRENTRILAVLLMHDHLIEKFKRFHTKNKIRFPLPLLFYKGCMANKSKIKQIKEAKMLMYFYKEDMKRPNLSAEEKQTLEENKNKATEIYKSLSKCGTLSKEECDGSDDCSWFDSTYKELAAYTNRLMDWGDDIGWQQNKFLDDEGNYSPEGLRTIKTEIVKVCRNNIKELVRSLRVGDLQKNVDLIEELKQVKLTIVDTTVHLKDLNQWLKRKAVEWRTPRNENSRSVNQEESDKQNIVMIYVTRKRLKKLERQKKEIEQNLKHINLQSVQLFTSYYDNTNWCKEKFREMYGNPNMYPTLHHSETSFNDYAEKYCREKSLIASVDPIHPDWATHPFYALTLFQSPARYPEKNTLKGNTTLKKLLRVGVGNAYGNMVNETIGAFDIARIIQHEKLSTGADTNRIIAQDYPWMKQVHKSIKQFDGIIQNGVKDEITFEELIDSLEKETRSTLQEEYTNIVKNMDIKMNETINDDVLAHRSLVQLRKKNTKLNSASYFTVVNDAYLFRAAFEVKSKREGGPYPHIYETINPMLLTKLFFDLEMEPDEVRNDGVRRNPHQMLMTVLKTVKEMYQHLLQKKMNVKKDAVVLSASLKNANTNKVSFHVTINNNTPFENLKAVNNFAWYVIERLWQKALLGDKNAKACFWKCTNPNCYRGCHNKNSTAHHCFVDEGVYTQWRQMRIYNSAKWPKRGKTPRPLVYYDIGEKRKVFLKPHESRLRMINILRDSLIQYTPINTETKSIKFDMFSHHYHYTKRNWSNVNSITYDYYSQNYAEKPSPNLLEVYLVPKNILLLEHKYGQKIYERLIASYINQVSEAARVALNSARSARDIVSNVSRFLSGFDVIMYDDIQNYEYLNEDPENFVILMKGGLNVELHNLNSMRLQHRYVSERTQVQRYNEWYSCRKNDLRLGPNNVNHDDVYVKVGNSLMFIQKPDWIYEGPVPEPRMFELRPTDRKVTAMVSRQILDGGNLMSGDHCNHINPVRIYELIPISENEIKLPKDDRYETILSLKKKDKQLEERPILGRIMDFMGENTLSDGTHLRTG